MIGPPIFDVLILGLRYFFLFTAPKRPREGVVDLQLGRAALLPLLTLPEGPDHPNISGKL